MIHGEIRLKKSDLSEYEIRFRLNPEKKLMIIFLLKNRVNLFEVNKLIDVFLVNVESWRSKIWENFLHLSVVALEDIKSYRQIEILPSFNNRLFSDFRTSTRKSVKFSPKNW